MTIIERGGNLAYLAQLRDGVNWYYNNVVIAAPVEPIVARNVQAAFDALTAMVAVETYGVRYARKPTRCLLIDLTTGARDDNITRFAQTIGVTRQAVDYAINHGREVGARSGGTKVVGFYDNAQQAWMFNLDEYSAVRLAEAQLEPLYGAENHTDLLRRLGKPIVKQ